MVKDLLKSIISKEYPGVGFDILIPPDEKLGDYSTNLAFVLAKKENKNPADIGGELAAKFLGNKQLKEIFAKIEFVGPGFVNFTLSDYFLRESLSQVLDKKDKYGDSKSGKGAKVNLEFISANPTGPLTVGNARAGSYGDALGNIMEKAGYRVSKEYYINDVGNQVNKLAMSVINEELKSAGKPVKFPDEDLYKGDYIADDAAKLAKDFGRPLSEQDFKKVKDRAIDIEIKKSENSVVDLGIKFDTWFRESELHRKGEVEDTLDILKKAGAVFEKDGAIWLKHGDREEDVAVLVKSDGATSYLMNDIAYTRNKLEKRGFDLAINIWGADHHGDVPRLHGGVTALGFMSGRLKIFLHQLVALRRDGELVRMSKRAGNIETLDALLHEVGKDAVRYFFLTKDLNTHMEFDIDLAKEQSKRNPVYYIQYANARLNSIFEKAGKMKNKKGDSNLLKEPEELRLLRDLLKFSEIVEDISINYQVHHLAGYTFELASDFHKFYEKHHVVQDDKGLESARLKLCMGIQRVLGLCLDLMGISAPEKM